MIRRLATILMVSLVVCATPAFAALNFDFDDGMQGWQWYHGTDTRINYIDGQWIAPGDAPLLNAENNIYGAPGGNLYTPGDANGRSVAVLKLTDLCAGGVTDSFSVQVDCYIPNLRPLTGFNNDYPGNMNHYAGLFVNPVGTDWGLRIEGRVDKGAQQFYDATSLGGWTQIRNKDWYMEDFTGGSYLTPDSLWWNRSIKLKLDWNYSSPGRVIASYYLPWTTYDGKTGWITIADTAAGADLFDEIMIGGIPTNAGTPWTKCQFDNVVFDSPDLVPEPASMLAMLSGLVGMVGFAARRRK